MKNKQAFIGLAGMGCLAVVGLLLWPSKDTYITQNVDPSIVFGKYIENPLYCEGVLAVNAIQSYQVDQQTLMIGTNSLKGTWSPLHVTPKQLQPIVQAQLSECPPLQAIEFKEFIPLTFTSEFGLHSFLFHPASATAFMQENDAEWRVIKLLDYEELANLLIDVAYKSDEAHGLDEILDEEQFESPYQYDLRANIEFYDDPEFFEQFKESEALLKEFDRFERAAGEARIEDFTNNR